VNYYWWAQLVFNVFVFEAYQGEFDVFYPTSNWMMGGGQWN
jgi:hypothetical protein